MSPAEHGFKSGGLANGFYRVFCLCGHKSTGADSATAHAYWREHMAEMAKPAEVPDGL